jgi:N6-adenosine-specific RNA methylase IME4
MPKRYGCVLADPPWPEIGGGKIKRGADRHYPVMTVPQIAALPVKQLVLPDAHLYLWTTNNYLERAFTVVAAWGFTYITTITWEKKRKGLGQYFRGTTEHVLFCKRGQPPYRTKDDGKRAQGLTGFETDDPTDGLWFEAERTIHSRKPDHIHTWAEMISPDPRLEMFARSKRDGWDPWGLETDQEETGLRLVDILS